MTSKTSIFPWFSHAFPGPREAPAAREPPRPGPAWQRGGTPAAPGSAGAAESQLSDRVLGGSEISGDDVYAQSMNIMIMIMIITITIINSLTYIYIYIVYIYLYI